MVGAANDVRNAHVNVVHHHRQLISRQPIGPQQNEVLDFGILHFARPENSVFELGYALAWDAEPNRARNALFLLRLKLRATQIAARACGRLLHLWPFVIALGFAFTANRVGTRIGRAFAVAGKAGSAGEQALRRRPVQIRALRLKVRAFVPLHTEPFQALEDAIHELRAIAFDVGVLNPKDQSAALMPGEKPIEKSGPGAPDVKITSR